MSKKLTTEEIANVFECADDEETFSNDVYRIRSKRRQRFFEWLAAHDAESAEALASAKRGARTLGEIVERQIEDMLRWAGMEDQIGTDDPDQQLAWERCAEMPHRIAELEAQVASLRKGNNS